MEDKIRIPRNLKLVKATYLKDYIYRLEYNNGKVFDTNFRPIVIQGSAHRKYLDVTRFKKMKIDPFYRDVYWGTNWDICFHLESIYGRRIIRPIPKKEIITYLKKAGLYEKYKERNKKKI